jgi:hypothetical protein
MEMVYSYKNLMPALIGNFHDFDFGILLFNIY